MLLFLFSMDGSVRAPGRRGRAQTLHGVNETEAGPSSTAGESSEKPRPKPERESHSGGPVAGAPDLEGRTRQWRLGAARFVRARPDRPRSTSEGPKTDSARRKGPSMARGGPVSEAWIA